MTEQSLNNLFDKARNEAPETNMVEIQKWIGYSGFIILITGFVFKLKTIFTSKIILMTSSLIVAASVSIGAYFFYSNSDKNTPSNQHLEHIQEDLKRSTNLLPIVEKTGKKLTYSLQKHENPEVRAETPIWEAILPLNQFAPIQHELDSTQKLTTISKPNEYGKFDAIKVSGAVEVVLIQGSSSSVRIEADEAGKRVVRISNDNGTLKISTENNGDRDSNFELTVYVTFTELKKIQCSGASEITSQGELKIDDLFLLTSGASEIDLSLSVNQMKIDCSGASELDLKGNADELELLNSGASEVDAQNLEIKTAKLLCSGASETIVHVTERLNIEVSGASEIKYKGNPTVEKNSSGASSIKHI